MNFLINTPIKLYISHKRLILLWGVIRLEDLLSSMASAACLAAAAAPDLQTVGTSATCCVFPSADCRRRLPPAASSPLQIATAASSVVPLSVSYRDSVKGSRTSSAPPPQVVLEAPTLTIPIPQEALDHKEHYRAHALVCRFNGLWPRLADLHSWISAKWTPLLEDLAIICPCARGFFVVIFAFEEDKEEIFSSGPWFQERSGLSMQPWTPSFDASTVVISSAPVWVRLPNLPLHFWGSSSLKTIGNSLGKFHSRSQETETAFTTYAQICVEMDFSEGFPAEIILQGKGYSWTQKLDYEQLHFKCRACFETGHLALKCKKFPNKHKEIKTQRKPTWWIGAIPKHQRIGKDLDADEIPANEKRSEPTQQTKEALPEQETKEPPKPLDSTSWADQADEENSQASYLDILKDQEQPGEWTKVSKKKKKPLQARLPVTRNQTGSLKV